MMLLRSAKTHCPHPLFVLGLVTLLMTTPPADAQEESILPGKRNQLETLITDFAKTRRQTEALDAEIALRRQEEKRLDAEVKKTARERERLEKLDREHPDTVRPESLTRARDDNQRAQKLFRDAGPQLKRLEIELNQSRSQGTQQIGEIGRQRKVFDADLERVVGARLSTREKQFATPRMVEAEGVAACGDLSVNACKDRSIKEAERVAVEQGSVVVVDSLTEISNLRMSKDQIRSETRGTLSARTVLDGGFVNGETAYRTKIRATVTPGLTSSIRAQIRQSIRDELLTQIGGEPSYALLDGESPRAAPTPEPTPSFRPVAQAASYSAEFHDLVARARRAISSENWMEAYRLADAAVRAGPEAAVPYALRARALIERSYLDEGTADAYQALTISPTLPEGLLARGMALQRQGKKQEAGDDYAQACQGRELPACELHKTLIGYDPRNKQEKAAYLLAQASEAFKTKRHDDVLALSREVLDMDSRSAPAMTMIASSLLAKARSDEAEDMVNRAIVVNPDFALAYNVRGVIRERKSQTSGARLDYETGCSLGFDLACKNVKRLSK